MRHNDLPKNLPPVELNFLFTFNFKDCWGCCKEGGFETSGNMAGRKRPTREERRSDLPENPQECLMLYDIIYLILLTVV